MRVSIRSVVPVCLLIAGSCLFTAPTTFAQDQSSQVTNPPKYLFFTNEAEKPGVSQAHEQNEAEMARALRDANSSFHALALEAITGSPRVLFVHGFASFADLEKEHKEMTANSSLMATLNTDGKTDGSFLEDTANSIYKYREDLSLRGPVDVPQMRVFELTLYHVRAGHVHDFETLAKEYAKAFDSMTSVHWAVFEKMYGKSKGATFLVATPMKSMDDVDQAQLDEAKLPSTMSAEQMQSLRELTAHAIESFESNLFAVSRKMSYEPDSWATASPDFWGKK